MVLELFSVCVCVSASVAGYCMVVVSVQIVDSISVQ